MSPQYRQDLPDIILNLTQRIERLERGHSEAGVGFVDLNGNVLFSVDGPNATTGFFGKESVQVATPVVLADVIALLQAFGLSA